MVSPYLIDPPLTTRERDIQAIVDKAMTDTLLDGDGGDRVDWCRRADRRLKALIDITQRLTGGRTDAA